MRHFLFILALYIPVSALASEPDTSVCASRTFQGHQLRWCLERGESDHVVYFFHGIGSQEERWGRSEIRNTLLERARQAPQLRPHVISVSFGRAWFFTDVQRRGKDSRLDAFLRAAMPQLERDLGIKVSRRTLIGESMGGYNALRLGMEAPESFHKIISLCPALLPVGPYSSREEIDAFKERNKEYIDARRLETLRYWAMLEFPTQDDWTRNNPLDRADHPIAYLPPVFLAQNLRDSYAFAEGTTAFATKLLLQGHSMNLRTEDSGHCRHSPELLREVAGLILGMEATADFEPALSLTLGE